MFLNGRTLITSQYQTASHFEVGYVEEDASYGDGSPNFVKVSDCCI